MKRPRHTGSVYRRPGTSVLWIAYYQDGKKIRESTGTTDEKLANRILLQKMGKVANGVRVDPKRDKIRMAELFDDLTRQYRINGRKSIGHLERRLRLHVRPFFDHVYAAHVNSSLIDQYVDHRQQESAENATVNRDLAILKRSLKLGHENGKVNSIPHIRMLAENNVRRGFLESSQHDRLAAECGKQGGLWLRSMFEVGYSYGWRHSEVLSLRVRQVDIIGGTIRLDDSKNGEGRQAQMTGPVRELLRECIRGKGPTDAVFTRSDGKPVKNFRKIWRNVCVAAEVPELNFHDLRRTAVRNMVRWGVSERVAMTISGHKTRSIFDRYNIVSEADQREAARKMEAGQQTDSAAALEFVTAQQVGHRLGTVAAEVAAIDARIPLRRDKAN